MRESGKDNAITISCNINQSPPHIFLCTDSVILYKRLKTATGGVKEKCSYSTQKHYSKNKL